MQAVRIHQTGGPEVLTLESNVPLPQPGAGEVQFKVEATGVNFIETYQRTGLYKVPLPFIPGSEAAGVVSAVGEGVTSLSVGDRIATASGKGGYAQYATAPAGKCSLVPASLSTHTAAAAMLQGMTAHYLSHSTFELKPGHVALVHAAAGGTGQLLVQMAKLLGATVIGTVSSQAKAQVAKEAGADHVILYTVTPDFDEEVKKIVPGGVHVVYDSVGKTTYEKSIKSLRPRGHLVTFGQSSGAIPPFDLLALSAGSFTITRPIMNHYVADEAEFQWRSKDVLGWIAEGKLKVTVSKEFPLEKAGEAHEAIQSRDNAGKILLIPPPL